MTESASPVPLRFHHIRIFEAIASNIRFYESPKDSEGQIIPIGELYKHPQEASWVAFEQARNDTLELIYRSIDLAEYNGAYDRIGRNGKKTEEGLSKLANALEFFLAAPPDTSIVLKRGFDMICQSCVRVNNLGVGYHCVTKVEPELSMDVTHQLAMGYFAEKEFPPQSIEAKFQASITRISDEEKNEFVIPLGILRQEEFLKAYKNSRREAWAAGLFIHPDLPGT